MGTSKGLGASRYEGNKKVDAEGTAMTSVHKLSKKSKSKRSSRGRFFKSIFGGSSCRAACIGGLCGDAGERI
jgi:hypothetical protein